jgi:hypothetical protein
MWEPVDRVVVFSEGGGRGEEAEEEEDVGMGCSSVRLWSVDFWECFNAGKVNNCSAMAFCLVRMAQCKAVIPCAFSMWMFGWATWTKEPPFPFFFLGTWAVDEKEMDGDNPEEGETKDEGDEKEIEGENDEDEDEDEEEEEDEDEDESFLIA